jgi:predicted nucleic acid-binding protein
LITESEAGLSELIELPDDTPHICRDPKDDMVIACTVAGAADVIISGDENLLEIVRAGNIPIVTARQLVDKWNR